MKRAFYDFAVSPYSFDFAIFLMCTMAQDCDEVVIVPGKRMVSMPDGSVREFQKCTEGEQEYRLNNLMLGLCPKAIVCGSREEAATLWHEGCFPPDYTIEKPVAAHTLGWIMRQTRIHPFMPAPEKVKELEADGWKRENMAVITIRDTHIKSARNSHVAEWIAAADWIKEHGLVPVFIPDTEKPDEKFGDHLSVPKAALDVQYRLALYEAATVNLGVNNGPMALNLFSRRPMLYFRPITHGYPESEEAFWRKNGVPINSQPPWFSNLQRIIWDSRDEFENITLQLERWLSAKAGKDIWPLSVAPKYPIYGVVDANGRGAQMTECMKHGFPQMKRKPHGQAVVSVVCYGPSLKETWRYIKRPMITVSGAHDFLIERGVIPDYHVDCDPREHKAKMLTRVHKDVKYRMATVCHPLFWDLLKDRDVEVWHLHNGPETDKWLNEHDPGANRIGGGSTAGMRAIEIASMLGFRRLNLYGMDCSFESDTVHHAGEHKGKKQNVVDVNVDGTWYKSSPQMIEAAKEMITFIQNYDVDITYYGHGLQQGMVKHFLKRFKVIDVNQMKEQAA